MHPAPTQTLARLRITRLSRWLVLVTLDWAVIVLALVLAGVVDHWSTYVLAVVVIGTRQHALALMGHDGAHRLVCRSRWLNDVASMLLCFWPLGLWLTAYRKHHFTHHRLPGTARDPELAYKRSRAPQWDLPAAPRCLFGYLLKDILGLGVLDLAYVMRVVPPVRALDVVGPILWWSAALSILIASGNIWILIIWLAAVVTVFWAMFRLRVWTERLGTAYVHRVSAQWWQRVLFLPHNTWCHYEHHRWPSVPCWNLPRTRTLDPAVPVLSLEKLFQSYWTAQPIASGVPLAEVPAGPVLHR
jgi:fatty acid desaturase